MMEIFENLERIHMPHARLLYLIQEMHCLKRITIEEKLILKQMVFRDEKELLQILEDVEVGQRNGAISPESHILTLMGRVEEYLHERLLGGEASYDSEPTG